MKKLFFFIPALLLSLLVNAKEILIGSETSNIIHYTIAASSTSDGDVIILADAGPYFSTAGSDDYTKLVKNVTIKAADGIVPVVKLEVPFRMTEGKTVKFIGITFDGTSLTGYDFYFRFYDNSDNNLEFENCEFKNISKYIFDVYTGKKANSLKLTNCKLHDNSSRGILNRGTLTNLEINGGEIYNFTGYPFVDNYDGATLGDLRINGTEFYGNAKDIISGTATSHADSCIINNCYFHDNSRSAVYFAASTISGVETCDGVIVKNSTFANNDLSASSRSIIEVQNYGGTEADNIEVNVDHCTFYNNTTVNFDYSCIRSRKSTKVSITNSIFAYPSEIAFYATNCYGGTISNNLVYNLSRGHRSSSGAPAITNAIIADPLFTDAANGDFSLAGNWITMNLSPARGAATDGSNLGDPRWYTPETLPSTDFASPYAFVGAKAKITGNLWYDSENDFLYYNDKSECGIATWKINVTRAGTLSATLNMNAGTTTGHKFKVEIIDAEGNSIGEVAEASSSSAAGDIILPGTLTLPATGAYTVKLYNLQGWSSSKINSITLAYAGGAIIEFGKDAAASLLANADAIVSSDWSIEGGKITHAESKALTGWAKWNVDCADYGNYNVTVNISSDNGHLVRVEIFEDEAAAPIYTLDETSATQYHTGDQAIDLGNIVLDAREYVVKVNNTGAYSHVQIASIAITYLNGAQATLPATCTFADLMLSEKAHLTEGNLWFNTIGDSNPVGQWAKWNVKVASAGTFLFTMNVSSTNSQSYKISILDGETEIDAFESGSLGSGDKTVKHYFNLAAGNYTVKLENTYAWSQGHIVSLVVTQPSLLTIDEAATSNTVIHNNYRNGNHDIQIIRTITPNMYNTICLPFDVNSSQLQAIFGADVELRQMASATLSGDVLTLNFDAATSIYRGTPYLIKTTKAVVNPVFTDVEIKVETGQATSGDNANFVGSFIKGTVPAGEDNLFLGANDLLYFSEAATTIKGMRAYFQIHDVPSGAPIHQARIVEQGNVVTALEFINGEWQEVKSANGTIKTIENGQLILIRDGKRYNVMGVRF